MILGFGRHRGRSVSDVDTPWLAWAAEHVTRAPAAELAAIRAELEARRTNLSIVGNALSPDEGRQLAVALVDLGQRVHAGDAGRADRVHAVRVAAWVRDLITSAPTVPSIARAEDDSLEEVTRRRVATRRLLDSWAERRSA